MPSFLIRTVLDGRAASPRHLRQSALLAASWHAFARAFAPLEVKTIGEVPLRFRDALRELGVPLRAASPDANDPWSKTANTIVGAYREGSERVLLLDNDTCFLASPSALAGSPGDDCAAAVAGHERVTPAQWERIERRVGLAALPCDLVTPGERYRALHEARSPAPLRRLYVNGGVLLLPASPVFPALWSQHVARIRALFEGHALASAAVVGSNQAGLATALGHHRRFTGLPKGFNYRPLHFVLGDECGESPVLLHMTGDGALPEADGVAAHLGDYWRFHVSRRLARLEARLPARERRRRLDHLELCSAELLGLARRYSLDAWLRPSPSAPALRVRGEPPEDSQARELDRGAPVVIGGLGGSGTRIVAELVQGLGIHVGELLNRALDHLGFTLLFQRPRWFEAAPGPGELEQACALLEKATFCGLAGRLAAGESACLARIEAELRAFRRAGGRLGVTPEDLERLRGSGAARLRGFCGWGWKEPNSHVVLDALAAHFPRLRYVHVVRHGLDMAFSENLHQLRLWGARFGVAAPRRRAAQPAAQLDYWIRTTQGLAERAARGERVLRLDFEALCADPLAQIRALATFLGVPVSEERARALAEIPRRPSSHERYRERELGVLRPEQIAQVERLGFPVLAPRPRRGVTARLRALGAQAWRGLHAR